MQYKTRLLHAIYMIGQIMKNYNIAHHRDTNWYRDTSDGIVSYSFVCHIGLV